MQQELLHKEQKHWDIQLKICIKVPLKKLLRYETNKNNTGKI